MSLVLQRPWRAYTEEVLGAGWPRQQGCPSEVSLPSDLYERHEAEMAFSLCRDQ